MNSCSFLVVYPLTISQLGDFRYLKFASRSDNFWRLSPVRRSTATRLHCGNEARLFSYIVQIKRIGGRGRVSPEPGTTFHADSNEPLLVFIALILMEILMGWDPT